MKSRDEKGTGLNLGEMIERRWRLLVVLFWIGTCAYLLWERWAGIHAFSLGDTDDNIRIAQVRALLDGQAWYDLRLHRMNSPDGLNMHWSRLVDLPIAGFYLLLKPFMGGAPAERWAVALAPFLPMLIAMFAMAVTARHLLSPKAFWLALAILVCAGSTRSMFAPLRIDHHGWQLAMLAVVVAGLADPRRLRGGVVAGLASALSFVIGLEMLLYLGIAGIATALFWLRDREEAARLLAYGVSLAGGSAIGFLIFASNDNWAIMCDVLSPVWLSVVTVAGVAAVVLAWVNPASIWARLGMGAVAAAVLAAFFVLAWPECLGRLERVPEELDRLWLSNVREAMPVWRHGAETVLVICTIPVIGLVGYLTMLWTHRRVPGDLARWAALGTLAALAFGLLAWQTRAAAAAQLLAVPGATGLGWAIILWVQRQQWMMVRVIGTLAAFLIVSGGAAYVVAPWLKKTEEQSDYRRRVGTANWQCPTAQALRPVAQQPAGEVLTFVDLGPRLIVMTPHNAITGPYHRNSREILDVMHAFRGDVATAREIIDRRRIDYVLICPYMSESTIYRAEAPNGFYSQLQADRVPDWLERVQLPANSPYRMWRVRR